VATVCSLVFADLALVVERINDAVTSEVADFKQPGSVFTRDDMRWSTGRNVAGFLRSLADHRPPTDPEQSVRRRVGEMSAQRGVGLQPLIASFHIAYRELWSTLVERAKEVGGDAPLVLLGGGATIWERMHASISELTEGYNAELARRETLEMRTTSALLDAITDDASSDDARTFAVELGFRPDEAFRALTVLGPVASVDTARILVASITRQGGVAASTQRGRAAAVLVQRTDDAALEHALAEIAAETPVGIGNIAEGLEGARSSLVEAEQALQLASLRGGPSRFADDWILTLTLAHRGSVERLLRDGIRTGVSHPHLAEAVRVFAEADLSIAEGARRMRLSQNSFRYRLNRWQQLTSWDPRTFDGLARSVTALALVPRA
jgi:hypothetical protein